MVIKTFIDIDWDNVHTVTFQHISFHFIRFQNSKKKFNKIPNFIMIMIWESYTNISFILNINQYQWIRTFLPNNFRPRTHRLCEQNYFLIRPKKLLSFLVRVYTMFKTHFERCIVRKNVWILTVFYCKMMRNMEKKWEKIRKIRQEKTEKFGYYQCQMDLLCASFIFSVLFWFLFSTRIFVRFLHFIYEL